MDPLEKATAEIEIIYGRLHALHALWVAVAGNLPPEHAARAAADAVLVHERMMADMLGLPMPERSVRELERMSLDGIQVLQAAAHGGPPALHPDGAPQA